MRIEFYKQKWFGFGISSGFFYQKCYYPSRDHEKQLSFGINIGKWKMGITIYWEKLTPEEIEKNERYYT